jgi:uncharacterized protein YbjT (DUF2867 family)
MLPSAQIILVTGASGFIGGHVLNAFLEAGYKVRAAVRSEEIAKNVRKSHSKYADQLSFAVVPDIVTKDSFNEAVKGVNGVCICKISTFPDRIIIRLLGCAHSCSLPHECRRQ